MDTQPPRGWPPEQPTQDEVFAAMPGDAIAEPYASSSPEPAGADTDDLITRAAAATRFGVSVRTVDRWLADGRITRHTRRGGYWVLVDPVEVGAAVRVVRRPSA